MGNLVNGCVILICMAMFNMTGALAAAWILSQVLILGKTWPTLWLIPCRPDICILTQPLRQYSQASRQDINSIEAQFCLPQAPSWIPSTAAMWS
jgi:hypothetical protein